MSRFVIGYHKNHRKKVCSPKEPFVVVLEKGFFKNEISPFGVDFEICNFVDLFMPKHTHYTLTNIQKVKKHNREGKFKRWKQIIRENQ